MLPSVGEGAKCESNFDRAAGGRIFCGFCAKKRRENKNQSSFRRKIKRLAELVILPPLMNGMASFYSANRETGSVFCNNVIGGPQSATNFEAYSDRRSTESNPKVSG
jgi:hypothetical protein